MNDLGFNEYEPIYSRNHLCSINDISNIKIVLTQEEKQAFDEIKKAIMNKEIFPKPVIVRCAGGWVRDKLLKCNSDDIDLALDTMTGEEFGESLQKYFETIKQENLSIGKIQENPDKSKHLAAVTFKIGNIEFDAVNLRTETYSSDSRVPTMSFGTPKQDAFRRDLTINSLFYNINLDIIEDFTNEGIKDMINGIARTPLNAMITYRDDPLRVLRNIRHAITKLGFKLDDDIINAAQNAEIHQLLARKVSPERFAIEFEKMLKGYNVWIALDCLVKFGIAPILFKMPTNKNEIKEIPKQFDKDKAWQQSVILTKSITQIIMKTNSNKTNNNNDDNEEKKEKDGKRCYNLSNYLGNNKKEGKQIQKQILFSAFTFPFHGIKISKKKNKNDSLVMYFVLHSIPGMPDASKMGEKANIYHKGCQMFIDLLLKLQNGSLSNEQLSLEIGTFLRCCKDDWIYVMFLIKSVCINQYKQIDIKSIDELQSWIVTKSNLINCWKWKPLINGKELMERYKQYGLGQDSRLGALNKLIINQRLSKPTITINDLDQQIIEWLKKNPAPKSKGSKRKSKKK